uniref:Uncharacterized protein n=1 Tax=Arundo donax TaxID=35708 RepID=A0A0A9BER0_ARUDO
MVPTLFPDHPDHGGVGRPVLTRFEISSASLSIHPAPNPTGGGERSTR